MIDEVTEDIKKEIIEAENHKPLNWQQLEQQQKNLQLRLLERIADTLEEMLTAVDRVGRPI